MAILDTIRSPRDLKGLSAGQLVSLCSEIRSFLVKTVIDNGGHMASNLGVVELVVALNRVFCDEDDRIIYDVGHQCYTQKLLTGRKDGFALLRQKGGITGFPAPKESEYDRFITGHGNTALSAAIGMATAKKLKGEGGTVVAVIGDGSFGGGMVYEGMNNTEGLDNLVVILNDNKMSISKNVGSFSSYLSKLRLSKEYTDAKQGTSDTLHRIPVVGDLFIKGISNAKSVIRQAVYHDTFFEMMGFQYFGLIDGHNVAELCRMFYNVDRFDTPVFIHAITQKGKGHKDAEINPKAFHSVSPKVSKDQNDDFSSVFGRTLSELAEGDKNIVAVTAAMKDGTGLSIFSKRHRERFFDVGMAEQHAVTFAAGLSKEGLKPVVAIYSTFLQRSYDQILNDVSLNECDVLFAVDRAGLVPSDGETHQGIYDVNYLCQPIGSVVVAPSNHAELRYWLEKLMPMKGLRAIRYPRGAETECCAQHPCTGNAFDSFRPSEHCKLAIVSYGAMVEEAVEAARLLAEQEIGCDVIKLIQLNPIPEGLINELLNYSKILFLHDDAVIGGLGERISSWLQAGGFKGVIMDKGIEVSSIPTASVAELRQELGLDAESIVRLLNEQKGL